MIKRSREQKLIDIMFEIGIMTHSDTPEGDHLRGLDRDTYAEWIRHNLKECGFPTILMGMSWGVLEK